MTAELALVTGAFGNVGGAIAARLVADGVPVRTLTNRSAPPGSPIEVRPLDLDDPAALAEGLRGAQVLYNTFWMRTGTDGRGRSYDLAVERSKRLIDAAVAARVERIVHLSVVKPSLRSPYPYFRGKAAVEDHLIATGLPCAIVRPALVFGGDAAMLHDLARVLRRSPVFGLPGGGRFRVRPVHVDDVAELCLTTPARRGGTVVDAVGPERPTFRELVEQVRAAVGARSLIVAVPPRVALAAAGVFGRLAGTPLLTADELRSTMEGLADAEGPATGSRALSAWLCAHGAALGRSA